MTRVGPGDDRAYWRRRFFILCGGVIALGVCAWLFPGAHQPSAREVAATRASMAALAKQQALPPVAYGSAWPEPSKPAASPTPVRRRLPSAAKARRKVSTAYHPSPVPSASGGAAGACAPADIVLSLFTSQSSYAKGARPKFSVYAVSTSAAACTLPYGAGSVQVVVTRHGHVVWDSAACKPAGREAGSVHARRPAGADDGLEPQGRGSPRAARARCPPAPRDHWTRSP